MKNYSGASRRYCQVKLDGHFLLVKNTANGVECWSRKPTLLHLGFMQFTHSIATRCMVGAEFHGELWYPGKPASYVKTAIAQQDHNLRFSAFAISSQDAGQSLEEVERTLSYISLHTVPFWTPHPRDWEHARALVPDAEGLVYKDGNLLNHEKWKPVLTADLVVHDVKDGQGKYLGLVGSLVCGLADGTIVADVGGMDDETRIHMTDEPPIGRVVEVAYQYVGSKGRLRHPRFVQYRDDKRPEECVEI
jgi:hypothetical protein